MARKTDTDTEYLMDDILDYLMERDYDIGTNIKEEFPHSYKPNCRTIYLCKKETCEPDYVLTIKRVKHERDL